ncbi:MAG: HEAT repeat domain-containing protein [Gemmataceae bacterium]
MVRLHRPVTAVAGALVLALSLTACGCGSRPVTTAKYFSGEPVSHWLDQAKSTNAKQRLKALDVLGNVGPADPGAIPALITGIKDKDAKCRSASILALSKIGPDAKAALPALNEISQSEKDPAIKKQIQIAMDRIQGQNP